MPKALYIFTGLVCYDALIREFFCGDCILEILSNTSDGGTRETRSHVLFFSVEVVQLAPLLVDTGDAAILGSDRPDPLPRASAMVERNPLRRIIEADTVRIAWREARVRFCESLAGETVIWSMTPPLHRPGISLDHEQPEDYQTAFVGQDIQLGIQVRTAVQAAICQAESREGRTAETDGLTSEETEANLNNLGLIKRPRCVNGWRRS
jgi:hypothetical protein